MIDYTIQILKLILGHILSQIKHFQNLCTSTTGQKRHNRTSVWLAMTNLCLKNRRPVPYSTSHPKSKVESRKSRESKSLLKVESCSLHSKSRKSTTQSRKSESREKVESRSRLHISFLYPLCYSQSRSWYWV